MADTKSITALVLTPADVTAMSTAAGGQDVSHLLVTLEGQICFNSDDSAMQNLVKYAIAKATAGV